MGTCPPLPETPKLLYPVNNSEDISAPLDIEWEQLNNANTYELQLSLSSNFNDIEIEEKGLDTTSIQIENLSEEDTYYWRVRARNTAGTGEWSNTYNFTTAGVGTSIADDPNGFPSEFNLEQNYPNPFNPTTTISFSLPSSRQVTLKIYNLIGSEVTTLVNETLPAGKFEVRWDATNHSSGIYIYRLTAGDFAQTKKLTLIK